MSTFPVSVKQFEDAVVTAASLFTVARRLGPGQAARAEFSTLADALAFRAGLLAAEPDRSKMRLLVYAVTAEGRSVCIAESDFARCLKLRGE